MLVLLLGGTTVGMGFFNLSTASLKCTFRALFGVCRDLIMHSTIVLASFIFRCIFSTSFWYISSCSDWMSFCFLLMATFEMAMCMAWMVSYFSAICALSSAEERWSWLMIALVWMRFA